jgi:hypothetical protein
MSITTLNLTCFFNYSIKRLLILIIEFLDSPSPPLNFAPEANASPPSPVLALPKRKDLWIALGTA